MKHNSKTTPQTAQTASYLDATGPVVIRLTNDYIFKRILEKNETVLRALISSLGDRITTVSPRRVKSVFWIIRFLKIIRPSMPLTS